MENLINIEKCVENELKTNYLTRTNDNELILAVLQKSGIDINMPFSKLLKLKNRPSFKSITRARRKVQERYPELKDSATAEMRKVEESKYRQFAQEKLLEKQSYE